MPVQTEVINGEVLENHVGKSLENTLESRAGNTEIVNIHAVYTKNAKQTFAE
ncbi:MAG: hypothetical protein NC206_05830 [Bacteroides sp.]|nr:hypothetical protein [Roseburia sp.]MCM1346586.1 hypothetical protein [Bacteroides sp.]MCM1421400.1 hypothetical protein [Bacteroides sp.]